ncbi:MAG: hypothetical protein IT343_12905 [Candidatus Melainabacteria bacterium]|jgi:hypothetical protein|nr:hypothetical protein [Candidatus Melainabacteria bacterium]
MGSKFIKSAQVSYFGVLCITSACTAILISLALIGLMNKNNTLIKLGMVCPLIAMLGLLVWPLSLLVFLQMLYQWVTSKDWHSERGCLLSLAAILYCVLASGINLPGSSITSSHRDFGEFVMFQLTLILCNSTFCALSYFQIIETVQALTGVDKIDDHLQIKKT